MDSRNRIIVGVILVVVAITLLLLLMFKTGGGSTCDLVETKPKIQNLADLPKRTNKNFTALAIFGGHLEYVFGDKKDEKRKFLDLQLNSIEYTNAQTTTDTTQVILSADCATMEMTITNTGRSKLAPLQNDSVFQVQSIQVNLTTPNGEHKYCTIDEPNITFHPDKHYKCQRDNYYLYQCKGYDKTLVANLMTKLLEFEINGNEVEIKKYNFSKPAELC